MQGLTIHKQALVSLKEPEDDIVAFQMVEFAINYFGTIIKSTLDTKILEDGRQVVIDGNGFIPSGFEVPETA